MTSAFGRFADDLRVEVEAIFTFRNASSYVFINSFIKLSPVSVLGSGGGLDTGLWGTGGGKDRNKSTFTSGWFECGLDFGIGGGILDEVRLNETELVGRVSFTTTLLRSIGLGGGVGRNIPSITLCNSGGGRETGRFGAAAVEITELARLFATIAVSRRDLFPERETDSKADSGIPESVELRRAFSITDTTDERRGGFTSGCLILLFR